MLILKNESYKIRTKFNETGKSHVKFALKSQQVNLYYTILLLITELITLIIIN